jgi:hypothetical protein
MRSVIATMRAANLLFEETAAGSLRSGQSFSYPVNHNLTKRPQLL